MALVFTQQEAVSNHPLIYLLWTHRSITDLGHVCLWCLFPSLFHHPLHRSPSFGGGGQGTAALQGRLPQGAARGRMLLGFGKAPFAGATQGVGRLVWEHLVLSSCWQWEVGMAPDGYCCTGEVSWISAGRLENSLDPLAQAGAILQQEHKRLLAEPRGHGQAITTPARWNILLPS